MLGTDGGESRCDWQRMRRLCRYGAHGATGGSVAGGQVVCAVRARALWSRLRCGGRDSVSGASGDGERGVTLGLPQREVVVSGEASFALLLSAEQQREVEEECRSCVRVAPAGDVGSVRVATRPVREERATRRRKDSGVLSAWQAGGGGIGCSRGAWRRSQWVSWLPAAGPGSVSSPRGLMSPRHDAQWPAWPRT